MWSLRVCVVSAMYHPSLGGLGRQARLLTERLEEEGVDVFVISRHLAGIPDAEFSPKVKIYRTWSLRPNVLYLPKASFMNILISLSFSVSCAWMLLSKRKSYDIVHFHGASIPLLFNLPLLKLMRKKVMAKVAAAKLGTEVGALRGYYWGLGNVLSKVAQMADGYIATTEEIEEGLKRDGMPQAKITRVTNFIDQRIFCSIPDEEKRERKKILGLEGKRIVLFAGRFFERKGIGYLLEAWRDVIHEFTDSVLVLLGDGPLFQAMKDMAEDLGIADSVDFRGHVTDVVELYQASDVFVLPSLQEGMPNSLLEAMACGLPVVATKIGGVTDIITDGEDGIIVAPEDSASLAAGIGSLLRDREAASRLALNALKKISESFSLDTIVRRYISLYEKLKTENP